MLDELAAGEQDTSLVRQIDLNSLENYASDDKSKGKTDQGIMWNIKRLKKKVEEIVVNKAFLLLNNIFLL